MTVRLRPLERILSNGVLFITLILAFMIRISGSDDPCEARCEKHRSRGWTGSYFFNCEAEYPNNSAEKTKCQNDCDDCPETVCSRKKWGPNNFRCPKTKITGECLTLCEQFRPRGNMNGYVLTCENVYDNPRDIRLCREKCIYSKCPHYMCNKDNPSIIYCPIGELDKQSDCWKNCEKYRDAWNENLAYSFQCSIKANASESEKQECQQSCASCPLSVCDPSNADTYFCPSNYPPKPLPTTPQTTPLPDIPYDGPCKRRCDKYRLGGISAYSFSCDSIFQSTQDFADCLSDCLRCPSKVCTFEDSSPKFSCPEAEHVGESKPPPYELSPLCIFFLVLALLFIFCFFSGGGVLLYKRRLHFEKKRREIKKRFAKRVSFQDPAKTNKLDVPKEAEFPSLSSASSVSVFDTQGTSPGQSDSSF